MPVSNIKFQTGNWLATFELGSVILSFVVNFNAYSNFLDCV